MANNSGLSVTMTETMLGDLVSQQLKEKGVLGKIQAQLRAHVFCALEENADFKKFIENSKLREYARKEEGSIAIGLVADFLKHFGLEFSLSVLEAECNTEIMDKEQLLAKLPLDADAVADSSIPLLANLLKVHLASFSNQQPLNVTYTTQGNNSSDSIVEQLDESDSAASNQEKEAEDAVVEKKRHEQLPPLANSATITTTAHVKNILSFQNDSCEMGLNPDTISSETSTCEETASKFSNADYSEAY